MDTTAPEITLLDQTVTLVPPSPIAIMAIMHTREEMEAMDMATKYAHWAMALHECWPRDRTWPVKPRPRLWSPGRRAADIGAGVFDGLRRGGVTMRDLLDAVITAYNYAVTVTADPVTEEEVKAAEDFSGAPEGG